ncbi:hypothetical protein Patl1_26622 [Pistacia atlantica]|uniref:Uncharacterized protein n=1 Tax=Pistacia atlantica TaxID=434234 RepID=A0ACC1B1X3_9ROSI|nr:hypothetical protein Patl1_26622 [Pistacia atlantica]
MTNWKKYNLCFSILVASLLLLLHHQYENNQETIRKPCGFDALMISVMFCFMGVFGVSLVRNKPQHKALRRFYFVISMVSMDSALSILALALFSESFGLVSRGNILWQNEDGEDHLEKLVLFLKKNSQKLLKA